MTIKMFPTALELAFWNATIYLLTGSPPVQRLVRWIYPQLCSVLSWRWDARPLGPILASLTLALGLVLGFLLGFIGLELLL